ncbi:MAG: peptidoglycan bridge formation glycyltransferase FemA/FemB family protein [Candidatus Aminicenantes bacterium]|jgi:lipid II:glycine glycyltransferase (peptidoglycan interpeptide bridge formation enzyme)
MREYRITNRIDRKQWSDFVLNHPRGNIFQTPEMSDLFTNTRNNEPVLFAVLDKNQQIRAVLLAVLQREYAAFLGSFTARAITWGGPLVVNNDPEILGFLLGQYDKFMGKKVIYSQFRNLWQQKEEKKVFDLNTYRYEEHLNILVNLEQSEEELWKKVNSKRRNEIRRAKKEGTTIREMVTNEDIREVYNILKDVYTRARLPLHDCSLFFSAFKELRPKGLIKFFGAISQDKIIGTIVVLCYKDRIYNWYAGSFREYYNKYPNDLLPWEVFLWGKGNGYNIFDFGGAGKPGRPYGVRDYKKKFGGEFVHFGRYEKIHKPALMKVGKLGLKLWQKFR